MIDECEGAMIFIIFIVSIVLLISGGVVGVSVEQKSLKEDICKSTQVQVENYFTCKQMPFNDIIKRMEVKLENSKE